MSNGPTTYYKPGSWNAVCDYCGSFFKAEELKKDWKGLMACEKDWEPRQPQDFAHGIPDNMTAPWQRVQLPASYISTGTNAIAEEAIASNAISDNLF